MNRSRVNITVLVLIVALWVDAVYGFSCTTADGKTGNCISIYSCKYLLRLVNNKNRTPEELKYLKESQCGFNNGVLVCCGDEPDHFTLSSPTTTTTTTTASSPVTSSEESGEHEEFEDTEPHFPPGWENPLIPGRSQCGSQEADRIFGGENADIDEYPWMAILQYKNRGTGWLKSSCGGSLINPRYVLTAGHCLVGDITSLGPLTTVVLGDWNTATKKDCATNELGIERCNSLPPVYAGVDKIIPHEYYNPHATNKYNDIGLVRLDRNVEYTNYIRPICLPEPSEKAKVGDKLVVSGWGRTENNTPSAIKQKLKVPVVSKTRCRQVFSRHGVTLDNTQLCAGGEEGKDSCAGDSGGPLMKEIDYNNQWYLEGLVSFGLACGTKDAPGVYTRIVSHLKWIHSKVES